MCKYVYEGHLGGFYTSDVLIDSDELYCEECGDYDYELGHYATFRKFLEVYANDIDADDGWGGYTLDSVIEIADDFDDKLTKEEVKAIVIANRTEEDE